MIAELKRLMKEATEGPWEFLPHEPWFTGCRVFAGSKYIGMIGGSDDIEAAIRANAALIVFLRNHAEALLAVCEAAEKLVAEWEVPDCDCPAEGHICGWPKVVALKMALARLKEGE
jgi:hypothetical protein